MNTVTIATLGPYKVSTNSTVYHTDPALTRWDYASTSRPRVLPHIDMILEEQFRALVV